MPHSLPLFQIFGNCGFRNDIFIACLRNEKLVHVTHSYKRILGQDSADKINYIIVTNIIFQINGGKAHTSTAPHRTHITA